MYKFFDWVQDKYNEFTTWLLDLIKSTLLTFFDMVKDVFYWIFETILDFIITLLDGLELGFDTLSVSTLVGNLPAETKQIMGLIRLDECILIILAAIILRLTLQLIPFTRLGS